MAGELTNVLKDIIGKAAKAPVGDGSEIARIRKRFNDAGDQVIAVCDCSGSMYDPIGNSNISKIEHLRIALRDLQAAHPKLRILAFGSRMRWVTNVDDIDANLGGTNLAGALEEVSKLKPRRTIIISDGVPDNKDAALDMVDLVTGRIDCVYCGPDGHPAIAYLHSLARRGGGDQMTFDGCNQLGPMVRALIGPPESNV